MTLDQLGAVASSKSAIHTLAPELSALMLIFRLVGPVISQRRSARPGAGGGDPPGGVARGSSAVSVRKSTGSPAEMRLPRSRRAASSSARRPE